MLFDIYISHLKVTICELATGHKFTEEWTFLPDTTPNERDWNDLVDFETGISHENYLLLDFEFDATEESGDLLMLNLVSRKQFWMTKQNIRNQIKEKAPEVDFNGDHYNANALNDFNIMEGSRRMHVERSEIEINYRFKIRPYAIYAMAYGHLGLLNITFV